MKPHPSVRFAVVFFLWIDSAAHLHAQNPAPVASPAASPTDVTAIMNESFPTAEQIRAASPTPPPVPPAAAAVEQPAPLAPMPAGLPTPMPRPVISPVPALTNAASLSLGLGGAVEQGIPDPMQMTFPTVPEIPEPASPSSPDPVTTIKLPPASSLELRLTPDATRLGIDAAIQTGLEKNPEILTTIQQIRLTRGQLVQVRAALLPTLQVNSGYNVESDALANPVPDFGLVNNNQAWNVAIQINQNIWSGWKNQADFSAARLANDSAFYSLRQTIDKVVADTKKLFYDVIFNRALIRVREESVAVLQSQLQDQQSRFEAGTVPRFNVLQAEVALANAIPPVIQARNNLRISQFALVKQLGLDYPSDPSLVPIDVIGQLDYSPIKLDLGAAVFTALARNPSLKVQRQNILIGKEQLKAALSGFQPTLNATAGYQAFNVATAASLDEAVNGLFVGLVGSWNIFDGLATVGATQAARASLQQSMINYDNAARGVELDVQRAVSNLIEAQEVIDSQRANVVQATEALRLSRERLDAGAGTQLDVLNAQVSLLQAQTTELEGRFRYITALAEYNRVLSLDTVYADTYDDPMLTARERQRNDVLNSTDNPNPGVLHGAVPDKRDTLRVRKAKPAPTPRGEKRQPLSLTVTGSLFQPLLAVARVRALFVPRLAGIEVGTDRETVLQRLAPAHAAYLHQGGFDPKLLATAGQVHGGEVAVVRSPGSTAGVDALVTDRPDVVLGIYVADCAAVYLADRQGRAIALVHSGRAGTTAGITARTIAVLQTEFGIAPDDLMVEISPCIRPPLYETDFAAEIAAQAREAGAGQVIDAGICTGREVGHYYSYRVEHGRTGRMLAALQMQS